MYGWAGRGAKAPSRVGLGRLTAETQLGRSIFFEIGLVLISPWDHTKWSPLGIYGSGNPVIGNRKNTEK